MDISILTHSQVSKPLFSEWLTSLLDLNWLGELWYQVIWNKIPKKSILPWHLFANKIKFNWEFCSNCDCNAHWRTSNATAHHTRCTMCTMCTWCSFQHTPLNNAPDTMHSWLHSTLNAHWAVNGVQCSVCTVHTSHCSHLWQLLQPQLFPVNELTSLWHQHLLCNLKLAHIVKFIPSNCKLQIERECILRLPGLSSQMFQRFFGQWWSMSRQIFRTC